MSEKTKAKNKIAKRHAKAFVRPEKDFDAGQDPKAFSRISLSTTEVFSRLTLCIKGSAVHACRPLLLLHLPVLAKVHTRLKDHNERIIVNVVPFHTHTHTSERERERE